MKIIRQPPLATVDGLSISALPIHTTTVLKSVSSQSASDLGVAECEYKDALIAIKQCRSEIDAIADVTTADIAGPLEDLGFALEEHQATISLALVEIADELNARQGA